MKNPKEEVPSKSTGFITKQTHKYPFDSLKVGESFDVGKYSFKEQQRMAPYLHYYNKSRKNFGRHFCSRKVEVKGVDTLRIYRDDVLVNKNKGIFKGNKKKDF